MLTREHFSLQYTFYLGGWVNAIQQKRTSSLQTPSPAFFPLLFSSNFSLIIKQFQGAIQSDFTIKIKQSYYTQDCVEFHLMFSHYSQIVSLSFNYRDQFQFISKIKCLQKVHMNASKLQFSECQK